MEVKSLFPWIQPSDFKAENITVVLLRLFYVCYRQFRYRWPIVVNDSF